MSAAAALGEVARLVDQAERNVRDAISPALYERLEALGGVAVVSTKRLRDAMAGAREASDVAVSGPHALRAAADVLDPPGNDHATAMHAVATAAWLRVRADVLEGNGLHGVRPLGRWCGLCRTVREISWRTAAGVAVCDKCRASS